MQLSPHFSLAEATASETATRKGIRNVPTDADLERMVFAAGKLEDVRELLGRPLHVNSWLRVLRLNRAVGSKDTSDHVLGLAIDFICPQFGTPLEICREILASGTDFAQLIWERDWVHISFNFDKHHREVLTAQFDSNGRATYRKGLPE